VIIDQGRTLLIRRGSEPLAAMSIPRHAGAWRNAGGGVARIARRNGIKVRVIEIIECSQDLRRRRTILAQPEETAFHYVIVDYLANASK